MGRTCDDQRRDGSEGEALRLGSLVTVDLAPFSPKRTLQPPDRVMEKWFHVLFDASGRTWPVTSGVPYGSGSSKRIFPRRSMYAIYAYIDPSNHPNVGKYDIHGVSGIALISDSADLESQDRGAELGGARGALVTSTHWMGLNTTPSCDCWLICPC